MFEEIYLNVYLKKGKTCEKYGFFNIFKQKIFANFEGSFDDL